MPGCSCMIKLYRLWPTLVGLVGFRGEQPFGAVVFEVGEEVGGLDFLDKEGAGVIGGWHEVSDEGALGGRIGVGGERAQDEEAEGESMGRAGHPGNGQGVMLLNAAMLGTARATMDGIM